MNIQFKSSKGIGLIEVLITTVIISLGLLAIASMQGNFLSESGVNKAKSEAQVFAEQKIEEFRNVVTKDAFTALASGSDTMTGKNAVFTRTWTIADLDNPERKTITVNVTWSGGSITLSSELAWNVVGNSSVYSTSGGSSGMANSLPSPSSDAASVDALDTAALAAAVEAGNTASDGYGFQIYRNDAGKQVIADGSYDDGAGRQLTCDHVCLTIKGDIFLENASDYNTYEKIRDDDVTVCSWKQDVDNIADGNQITITEDVSGTNFAKREYICYFGGDCDYETADTYAAAGCPANYADLPAVNVRGGWRGNIGIVGFSNPTNKTLCFLGQVGGTTRRSYKTTRINGAITTQEGINTNYECHDFLMVTNPSGSEAACDSYTQIEASSVIKNLTGAYNVDTALNSISTDSSSCDATNFSFSGTITGTDSERLGLSLAINSVNCQIGPTTGSPSSRNTEYTCTTNGTSGDSITLEATSSESVAVISDSTVVLSDGISAPNITFTSP